MKFNKEIYEQFCEIHDLLDAINLSGKEVARRLGWFTSDFSNLKTMCATIKSSEYDDNLLETLYDNGHKVLRKSGQLPKQFSIDSLLERLRRIVSEQNVPVSSKDFDFIQKTIENAKSGSGNLDFGLYWLYYISTKQNSILRSPLLIFPSNEGLCKVRFCNQNNKWKYRYEGICLKSGYNFVSIFLYELNHFIGELSTIKLQCTFGKHNYIKGICQFLSPDNIITTGNCILASINTDSSRTNEHKIEFQKLSSEYFEFNSQKIDLEIIEFFSKNNHCQIKLNF